MTASLRKDGDSPNASNTSTRPFEQAIKEHDRTIASAGIEIWVGSEPTFTDRCSEAAEWLVEALGPDKEARARRLLGEMERAAPSGLIFRTVGKQYPGEDRPRWSLGLYRRRDASPLWDGPPDPLAGGKRCSKTAIKALWKQLQAQLQDVGWNPTTFAIQQDLGQRLLFRLDGQPCAANAAEDPRLARPALDSSRLEPGLRDELAEDGQLLVAVGCLEDQTGALPRVELPSFPDPQRFAVFLNALGTAAQASGLKGMVLTGYPPPVDASVSWTTLTPDPAVVEINLAPARDVTQFLQSNREIFALSERQGLTPYRLQYNGDIADSGGGGQLTLGGPSPQQSPFLVYPQLLPNLIRYVNHHPSLSYYFASDFIGGSSQSPRPDESGDEVFAELDLALQLLSGDDKPSPETLWQTLAPFMSDASGNPHRCELNIEKLWNPNLPGRGYQGLVEFRALRMQSSPEKSAAIAALLRAIMAHLIKADTPAALKHWGSELHDRFALPYYLRQDLNAVFADLHAAGFSLAPPITELLCDDEDRLIGQFEFGSCHLTIKHALEFWPLVGDVASQEHGGSRLVDSSTSRIEVCLEVADEAREALDAWQLSVDGYALPLRFEKSPDGWLGLRGVRYRSFTPWHGLHPALPAHGPLRLTLLHRALRDAVQVTLYDWRPDGRPYDGLPRDREDARHRRAERFVVEYLDERPQDPPLAPPDSALTPYCLDLRRLASPSAPTA